MNNLKNGNFGEKPRGEIKIFTILINENGFFNVIVMKSISNCNAFINIYIIIVILKLKNSCKGEKEIWKEINY